MKLKYNLDCDGELNLIQVFLKSNLTHVLNIFNEVKTKKKNEEMSIRKKIWGGNAYEGRKNK